MSENLFYVRGRNRGNERKVILQTATLLVGKAPAKQKRIKMKLMINLSADRKVAGTPEWIVNAFTFVSQNHDVVQPQVELNGYDVTLSAENLFGDKSVTATKCSLRKFVIAEIGDAEEPEVAMVFSLYAPFSSKLLTWCGQMAGEEAWAKFDQIETEPDDEGNDEQLELSGDDDPQEEEPEEDMEPEESEESAE